MTSNEATFGASFSRFGAAAKAVAERPLLAIVWIAALVVAQVIAPIWGTAFVMMGWLESRRRMNREGLMGIGAALAPDLARQQFEHGIWAGIWRTQKLSVSLTLIQLPTVLLAFAPAGVAYVLFSPTTTVFHGIPALVLSYGVPGLVGLACFVVVAAEQLVTYRILAESGPDYSLGLVFRAVSKAWRATLSHGPVLLGMTVVIVGAAVVSGSVVAVSAWAATLLKLGGGGVVLIAIWTGALMGMLFLALVSEALAGWTDDLEITAVEPGEYFAFSEWLVAWVTRAARWLADKGVVSVGIVACLVIGILTGVVALITGKNFESWVGLGWFAVTSAVLVMLHRHRRQA